MNPPARGNAAGIGNWVFQGTGTQSVAEFIVWDNGANNDINTALYRSLGTKEFSLATRRLQGCTVLAIVSRKGVYLGHYWESISFDPDEVQLKHIDQGVEWRETPDEIFERTVIGKLRRSVSQEQTSLTSVATALADDYVSAYLIRPRISRLKEIQMEEDPDSATPLPDGYPEQWQRIKDEVVRLIPKINETGRWSEVLYDATDDLNLLDNTWRGRMLFMFDPVSQAITSRRQRPTRMIKLWSEATEIHSDVWQG